MGLLLSILVFSVGVLEVIACARHIQYGYLPEWAPRRHLVVGTSGITNFRDHWRKKPSGSVEIESNNSLKDVRGSRDTVQCSKSSCNECCGRDLSNLNECGRKVTSENSFPVVEHDSGIVKDTDLYADVNTLVHPREHTQKHALSVSVVSNASNFKEVSTRTSHVPNTLPYEKPSEDISHKTEPLFFKDSKNNAEEINENHIVKTKPQPLIIQRTEYEERLSPERALSVETLSPQTSTSQSPSSSPKRSKADISWPLFAPHCPVSRRPSTPTTAEELPTPTDGDISPYFGGEILTDEHARSTQRPLEISTETYHADKDITPVLVDEAVALEDKRSIYRPLTVSTRADGEFLPNLLGDSTTGDHHSTSVVRSPSPSILSDKDNAVEEPSTGKDALSLNKETSADDSVMSSEEEQKSLEAIINQRRRTSKTEYLPREEIAVEVMRKRKTPEHSFATEIEEPGRLKPAKAASFEEARLECFKTQPLFPDLKSFKDGARRASLLSDAEKVDTVALSVTDKSNVDDSSAVVGRIEVKPKDSKSILRDASESVSTISNVISAATNSIPSSALDESFTAEGGNDDIEFYDRQPLVEVTAISIVDQIINQAMSNANKRIDEKSSRKLAKTSVQDDGKTNEPDEAQTVTVPAILITPEMYDRQPLVEVAAITVVDKIINDAVSEVQCKENSPRDKGNQLAEDNDHVGNTSAKSTKRKLHSDPGASFNEPRENEKQRENEDKKRLEQSSTILKSFENLEENTIETLPVTRKQNSSKVADTTDTTKIVPEIGNRVQTESKMAHENIRLNMSIAPPEASTATESSKPTPETSCQMETAAFLSGSEPKSPGNNTFAKPKELRGKCEKQKQHKEDSHETNSACKNGTKRADEKGDSIDPAHQGESVFPASMQSEASYAGKDTSEITPHGDMKSMECKQPSSTTEEAKTSSRLNKNTSEAIDMSQENRLELPGNTQKPTVKTLSKTDIPESSNSGSSRGRSEVTRDLTVEKVESERKFQKSDPEIQSFKEDSEKSHGCDVGSETNLESRKVKEVSKGKEEGNAVNKKSIDEDGGTSSQQEKPPAPEAFWLIFSGEYTKAMSKDWHSGHFCCWQCDESLTGQRYVLRDDHPYCIKCYESVFANICEECNKTIGIDSKDLSYKDKHWHEACFLCTKCRVSLVDKQFGSKADKIYCGNCYDAQFASRCDGCGEIFRAGTKKMEYKTRQWHEKCFCCCVCKTAIGTKSFIPREQEIYCATCYEEKFATRCVKCNKIITSGGVTYKNEPWHRECFTCTNCNTSLAGQRFTSRDEKPYCAECFGELFAKRCTACSKPITGIGGTRFISFEDRHWHNDCFICASCKTSLVGRGFITDADDIICPECAKQKLM